MSSGLVINVPSKFNRVLTDLSFIPDAQSNALAYIGLFGGDESSSTTNTAMEPVKINITGIATRTPGKINYDMGFISFTGPGIDTTEATGVLASVALSSIDKVGFPGTMACSFRKIRKVKEDKRRLYPFVSFMYNKTLVSGNPLLCIAACILDTGEHRISALSGGLPSAGNDALASKCSVPIDFSKTDELITAAVSRSADGTVMLAVKHGNDRVLTAEAVYNPTTDPNNPANTEAQILFGSANSRTVDSGDIMMGQYWQNTAMTMLELEQQVELTHMKAQARL